MAAPLPTGSSLQALPLAPQIQDPRLYAADPQGALLTATAGLHLGNELANLDNLRSQRELEAAKIKHDKALNDLQMLQIEHAQTNLPQMVATQVAQARQQQAEAETATALANARAAAGVPNLTAGTEAATGANALASAKAAGAAGLPQLGVDTAAATGANALASAKADAGLAATPADAREQKMAAAKTLGSWGMSSGGLDDNSGVPPIFRETKTVQEVDPQTGNTVERAIVLDKRDGSVIAKGEPVAITKLGADEKSAAQSLREVQPLLQAKDVALKLDTAIDEYIKAGEGGLGQAMASNAANSTPTGQVSVIKKAIGAAAQSKATVAINGMAANLRATMKASLPKEDSETGQALIPGPEDLSDPKRFKEKLQNAIQFLDTKIKPFADRGVLRKSGLTDPSKAPATAAELGDGPVDSVKEVRGTKYKMVVLPDGRRGWLKQP